MRRDQCRDCLSKEEIDQLNKQERESRAEWAGLSEKETEQKRQKKRDEAKKRAELYQSEEALAQRNKRARDYGAKWRAELTEEERDQQRQYAREWYAKHGAKKCEEHGNNYYTCNVDDCALRPSSQRCLALCGASVNRKSIDLQSSLCAKCRKDVGEELGHRKKFEEQMTKWLKEAELPCTYRDKKLPCAPTTRYPDFCYTLAGGHAVILEVDENQHRYYDLRCEIARIHELADTPGIESLHLVRYNPHAFLDWKEDDRKNKIITILKKALATNACEKLDSESSIVIEYVGYTEDRIDELNDLIITMQAQAVAEAEAEAFNY